MSSSAGCRRKTRTSNRVTTPKNKARRKTTRRVQPPRSYSGPVYVISDSEDDMDVHSETTSNQVQNDYLVSPTSSRRSQIDNNVYNSNEDNVVVQLSINNICSLDEYFNDTERILQETLNFNTVLQCSVSPSTSGQTDSLIKNQMEKKEVEVIDLSESVVKGEGSPNKIIIECPICLLSLKQDVVATLCGHMFHSTCIKTSMKSLKKCPNCRKTLNMKSIHPIYF